jgi:hypothetical protein
VRHPGTAVGTTAGTTVDTAAGTTERSRVSWTRIRSRGHPAVWLPVVVVVGAMAALGAGAQTWVSARVRAISDTAATDRELAVAQALELIRLCETALLASSVVFAACLYAFFRRGLREGRLPPSGWWSLGAWRVASGPDVRRMGRLGLALTAFLPASAVAIILVLEFLLHPVLAAAPAR